MTVIIWGRATDGVLIAGDGRTCSGWPLASINENAEKVRAFDVGGTRFVAASSGRATIDQKPVNEHIAELVASVANRSTMSSELDIVGELQARMTTAPATNQHDSPLCLLLQYFSDSGPIECVRKSISPASAIELDSSRNLILQGQFADDDCSDLRQIIDREATKDLRTMNELRPVFMGLLARAYLDAESAAKQEPFFWNPFDIRNEQEALVLVETKWGAKWENLAEKAQASQLHDCTYADFPEKLKEAVTIGNLTQEEVHTILLAAGVATVGGTARIAAISESGACSVSTFPDKEVRSWHATA